MDPRITTAARLQHQKNYAAAEQIYRTVLASQPRNADAMLLLGLLLHETHRNKLSVEMLRRAAGIQRNRIDIRQTLARVLQFSGRIQEAVVEAREVLRLQPMDAESHYALAQLLLQLGDPAGALPSARRASELAPKSAAILVALSRIYSALKMSGEAMAAVERAIAAEPNFADAHIDRGQLLQNQGQLDRAITAYQTGLKYSPQNKSGLNNIGACLLLKGLAAESIPWFEKAAKLVPDSPLPPNNIGAAYKELGRIDDALMQYHRSIQLDPKYADGYCNIGGAYATIAEHEKAIAACREALAVNPAFAEVGSNLVYTTLSPSNWSKQQVFEEHLDWNRRHAAALANETPILSPRQPNSRLRIGYLSPDFREHSIRYFMEPIFVTHDRSNFEVFAYATGRRRDEVSDRLKSQVDQWHSVSELTDQQLADRIRAHGIDILVDLAGHTAENRLLVFARKPAPVQVTYLGYPTTTGMSAVDYRLTDSIADPPGADEFYTEKLVRLPHAFFVYSDDPTKPLDPVLPADRNGIFTFGSFNSFTKINDETLHAWAGILLAVPNSRLLMKARPVENPSTRQKLLSFFSTRGISSDRLDFRPWLTMPEHIQLLGTGVDLMLDTFPYNGHTTTCQALWMGVPVVTRSGDSFRSRVGHTIMHHLEMTALVAGSWQEYHEIAVGLATDLSKLRALRPMLRSKMIASPLCDAVSFTRSLEQAYSDMLVQRM
jgi:predicted O-linked N-acetylglucosamine transferase (SPINDLY family)